MELGRRSKGRKGKHLDKYVYLMMPKVMAVMLKRVSDRIPMPGSSPSPFLYLPDEIFAIQAIQNFSGK
ncbi:MAG: hypothetical protein ACXU9M_08140 [Thermodesulfobacteriota bacterium]